MMGEGRVGWCAVSILTHQIALRQEEHGFQIYLLLLRHIVTVRIDTNCGRRLMQKNRTFLQEGPVAFSISGL